MKVVMDQRQFNIEDQESAETQLSAREQVSALIAGARELANVELGFYRVRLNYSKKMVQRAGLFGLISMFFLFAATVALVLGTLMIIAAFFGPQVATLAVTIGFIAMAVIFGWLARTSLRKLRFPELTGADSDEPR